MAKTPPLFSATDDDGMSTLLNCLDTPANSYLIGAGVSSESVPLAGGLSTVIADKWLSVGSFDAEVPPHGPLLSSLGLDSLYESHDPRQWLLWRIYDNSIKAILNIVLSRAHQRPIPAAYRVFRRFPTPLEIYNMNVDGLASRIACPGVVASNLHGTVARGANWASRENSELADELIELGLELPGSSLIWYPQPEPDWITRTRAYQRAKQSLKRARCLFVVGYSFGSHGSSLDDTETFAFFCEMIRYHRLSVIVLNLNPKPLVELIATGSGTTSVFGVAIDWNRFARSLLGLPTANKWPLLPLPRLRRELLARYRRLLDQGDAVGTDPDTQGRKGERRLKS